VVHSSKRRNRASVFPLIICLKYILHNWQYCTDSQVGFREEIAERLMIPIIAVRALQARQPPFGATP